MEEVAGLIPRRDNAIMPLCLVLNLIYFSKYPAVKMDWLIIFLNVSDVRLFVQACLAECLASY